MRVSCACRDAAIVISTPTSVIHIHIIEKVHYILFMRRIWLERLGVGCVTAFALGVPLLLGLVGYLALSDGFVINANDPTREARLWMIREPRNIGIALTTVSASSPSGNLNVSTQTRCVRTNFTYLKFSGGLRLERTSEFCQCYELKDGRWVTTGATCV